jgi:hypothetical protein
MRKLLALAAFATLFSNPTLAIEHKGWVYNGLTGSASIQEDGLGDRSLSSNSSFGYRWGRIGVEVGNGYFGEFEDEVVIGGTPFDVDTELAGWTGGVNYNRDLNARWSVQGRAGLFNWNADGHVTDDAGRIAFEDSGTDFYAGASIDYRWSKRSSIGLAYTRFQADDASVDLWGMHSEFRF